MDTFEPMPLPYMTGPLGIHEMSGPEYMTSMPSFAFPAPGPAFPGGDVIS